MTRKRDKRTSRKRSGMILVSLTVALSAVIVLFRTLPAMQGLERQRERRAVLETRLVGAEKELERLDAFSVALGEDPQTTERALRRIGFARSGERAIADVKRSE